MTIPDLLAVLTKNWSEVLATFFALIALWQSQRAYRLNRKIAKYEGSLDQPSISLGLFGKDEDSRFLILAPVTPTPLTLPIPLYVLNQGTGTATEVQLLLRANETLLPYNQQWKPDNQPDASGVVTASLHGKVGNINSVMFRIRYLHPNLPLNLAITAVFSSSTSVRRTVPVETRDGESLSLQYELGYSHSLEAIAFHKDSSPLARSFGFEVLDTQNSTAQQALESYWQSRAGSLVEDLPQDKRWRLSPRRRIENICVITVDENKIEEDSDEGYRTTDVDALFVSEGILAEDGLWVPGLGVGLGCFQHLQTSSS